MKRLVTRSEQRRLESLAINAGISERELIERAADGLFLAYSWRGPVLVVCGSGNNAADGYALALRLKKAKIACAILRLTDRATKEGEALLDECKEQGIEIFFYDPAVSLSPYEEIVDCMLGIGFSGKMRQPFDEAAKKINESGKVVISADINSGLDPDSGIGNGAVKSTLTVTFGERKAGLYLADGRDLVGTVKRVGIGLPRPSYDLALAETEDSIGIFGERKHNSHKGSYGYVSILGGCAEYAGAVKLANLSLSALRSGCGVSQLIVPASIASSVSPYLLESTLYLLSDRNGHALFDEAKLREALSSKKALAIGMGWGSSPENEKILNWILTHLDIPLIIDADGLNTLSRMDKTLLSSYRGQAILTPHPKELERLTGIPASEILQNPLEIAKNFAKENRVILLFKGDTTVVTNGESTRLVARGCPGMATAGSGDVLSGILAGLLGYLPATLETVTFGAMLAGIAGELAEAEVGRIGMTSSDTVKKIPQAVVLFSPKT
ncbi:MAG: NAD(P)H-hydrate dehydratase [Clostridia bacterium]|nr:NAD(P)H-hydrate dehydratase [Clostridia bacterium]